MLDVVARELPGIDEVRFPDARKRLLELMKEDQADRQSADFFSTDVKVAESITRRELARAEELLSILERVRTPSVRNVGMDGSRAMWLIALHNFKYKNTGQIMLKKMRNLYYADKSNVYYPGIPFLADRLMVGGTGPIDPQDLPKQLYGTQGLAMRQEDGSLVSKPFPVINQSKLTERRRRFGLAPKTICEHRNQNRPY